MSYKLVGLNSLAAAAMLYFSVMILYTDTVSDKYPGFTGTPYTSLERSQPGYTGTPLPSGSRTVTRSLSGELQPEIGVSIPIGSAEAEAVGEKRGASAVGGSGSRDPSPPKKTALARVKEETEERVVHSGEHLGKTSEELRLGMNVKNENFVKDGLGN
jgi:hypothetical protein